MPAPYDYRIPEPTANFMTGVQQAFDLRGMQQQTQVRDMQIEQMKRQQLAAQKQAEMQAQLQADMAMVAGNPTPAALSTMMVKYPQLSEQFKRTYDVLNTEQQQSRLGQATQVFAALEAGKPEVAQQLLQEQAIAARNSGMEREAEMANVFAELVKLHPNTAKTSAGLFLAHAMGPEKFAETFTKLQDERRAQALEPYSIDEAKGKAAAANRIELAPAVKEAIDYDNLKPEQQQTFRALQSLKHPAAVTKINISNVEKQSAEELGKLVPVLHDKANDAADLVTQLPRYREALKSAVTGPFADVRLGAARIGNVLGFSGPEAVEATTELIQGYADMALKARGEMKGQGQITEFEQKLLIKARSGDLSFTAPELSKLLDVYDRAARSQYKKSRSLLESASKKSETASLFLENLSELPENKADQKAIVGGKTYARPANFTDSQWDAYKKSVGAQ